MVYEVDRALLRLTGELLAAGAGVFRADDVRRLVGRAFLDNSLRPSETAALLVAYQTVLQRADSEARQLLGDLVSAARSDDPDLHPWIVRTFSTTLLQRGAALVAGRGRAHHVPRSDIVTLIDVAYQGGKGPSRAITPDEGHAFLAIQEMLDGRLAADAEPLVDELCAAAREDGCTLDGRSAMGTTPPKPSAGTRQCGRCSGLGTVSCGSCGGHGYHVRTGTRTRYDGSTEYYQEYVPCSCTGGRVRCGGCGGSGRV